MREQNYKKWLLESKMTELSAEKYIRGLKNTLALSVEQRLLGEYDECEDAVVMLDLLEQVAADKQKYLKKYIRYLCEETQGLAPKLGAAVERMLAAFSVRERKAGWDGLLAALHPALENFLSDAQRNRLRTDQTDDDTAALRVLLRRIMAQERARKGLEQLLWERAKQIFDNRTDMELGGPLQALRHLVSKAAQGWRSLLPASDGATTLSFLTTEYFDAFAEQELKDLIARRVLSVLREAAGEISLPQQSMPLLEGARLVGRLTRGAPLPAEILKDKKLRLLLSCGSLVLSERQGEPCLQPVGEAVGELPALWQEEQTRDLLGHMLTGIKGEEIDLAVAVALLAAADEEHRSTLLYRELLRLICRESLALCTAEDAAVRLTGCEHVNELFTLCREETEEALFSLLPPDEQALLHRRDIYGNTLFFARLQEKMANCAMVMAEQESYFWSYAAHCFGRASAVAEGCGDREFALRTACGQRNALHKRALAALEKGIGEQENLYDHGLPAAAVTERIARLEGKESGEDIRALRRRRGELIRGEACPAYMESSPVILKPRGVEPRGFLNEYYIAALDSEVARRKNYKNKDVQSLLMMMLLQGQRVILSTNMLTDNLRILELADEPAFLELMRRGYILLSFYGGYHTLIELCADQLESRFEWSSMPFMNYIDAGEDPEIRKKRTAAADYLRGKAPYPALADPREKRCVALFKERLERFEEALSFAGLCYYYQRGKGKSVGLLRPQLDKFYRQHLTDPDFADLAGLHGIIDETLLRQGAVYNRSAYKNCIDLLAGQHHESFAATGEQLQLLRSVTPQQLEQLRDVLSDRHNYILASRISDYYHNEYRGLWLEPSAESGVSVYKNLLRVRESGERVDWAGLLEVLARMHALILERPAVERLSAQLSASGQSYAVDDFGKLRVERASLLMSDGEQVELSLSEEREATVHVETEREYER